MRSSDFEAWLLAVRSLTAVQRCLAFRELALAEAAARLENGAEESVPAPLPPTIVEAEPGKEPGAPTSTRERAMFADISEERFVGVGCPHCRSPEVRPWGGARGLPRYRCAQCRKTLNLFTGTPVAGLNNKDRWLDQAQALVEGESLAKAAERCRIHPSTAFRWRHRFLAALNFDKPNILSGIVEADETSIFGSFKGRRGGLGRPARRRGGKAAKRGLSAEQIPVVVARDRRGAMFDARFFLESGRMREIPC